MRPNHPSLYDALLIRRTHGRKALAVLLDPDNLDEASLLHLLALSQVHPVDYFFVGGSLVLGEHQAALITSIKAHSYGYDSAGRAVAVQGATDERAVIGYDTANNKTSHQTDSGATWQ